MANRLSILVAISSILTLEGPFVSAAEPTWFREKYAALIEIANGDDGAGQIDALFGTGNIDGLDEIILEGWRLMPGIDTKPIVEAPNGRMLEIRHLITTPDALPAIRGMFAGSQGTSNAVQAVLSRICKLPGAYILGSRGYQFHYIFWTPTFQQYGPLRVRLADCEAMSPFWQ